jgi:hypothetical protein
VHTDGKEVMAGFDLSPAFYLMGAATLSLLVILSLRESAKAPLPRGRRRAEDVSRPTRRTPPRAPMGWGPWC